ncbi:unnamed protein product [Kuraishia capsulata CBS 1993]|uniref:Uncharacterized protein n=1 Tax=Kuraishia capsulata CBS 1993 TaxID=1382522 RepID=W6MSG1_9ASCO|nr:uncharacterized protein KUCA_T00005311001 [Kuraishia capsulata CBS 1993]CDK29323.1 unnamed protein product [Kuraishia capsulata CBS 1993]
MPSAELQTEVCLFDLDGTLIASTGAVEMAWQDLFKKYNLDGNDFFKHSHGVRTVEVFKKFLPQFAANAQEMATEFEFGISNDWGHLAVPIKGAGALIESLPKERWCIVTSGTPGMAHSWFTKVLNKDGFYKPDIFITASDVTEGKPHPSGYKMGADLLAQKAGKDTFAQRVVFEDAPAGVQAGVAAGARVIGITSSFPKEVLYGAGATYVVEDLTHVKLVKNEGGIITFAVDYI